MACSRHGCCQNLSIRLEITLKQRAGRLRIARDYPRAAVRRRRAIANKIVSGGGGLTGYLLLSESHIAFHTYPEHRFLALDILSCGSADSKAALSVFLAALEPGREHLTTAPRGAEIPRRD